MENHYSEERKVIGERSRWRERVGDTGGKCRRPLDGGRILDLHSMLEDNASRSLLFVGQHRRHRERRVVGELPTASAPLSPACIALYTHDSRASSWTSTPQLSTTNGHAIDRTKHRGPRRSRVHTARVAPSNLPPVVVSSRKKVTNRRKIAALFVEKSNWKVANERLPLWNRGWKMTRVVSVKRKGTSAIDSVKSFLPFRSTCDQKRV